MKKDVRLIDANALIEYLDEQIELSQEERCEAKMKGEKCEAAYNAGEIACAKRIKRYINKCCHPIDAVPVVHARWVPIDWTGVGICKMWQCSACKNGSTVGGETGPDIPYCFSCGAKMDGGAEGCLT